ncbi:glycosyltransferase [Bacteroides sp. OttesenSCG-928-N06]|nr:glycosyltransferase [Bacteroides sp. OttesenSCG-928-N06]
MKPLLSIIIPFFGEADPALLDRCLASIRTQGLNEDYYEIIIPQGDGRSAASARNEGIERAQGHYLFFVDADDYLFPNTLATCMEQLITHQPDMLSFEFEKRKPTESKPVVQPPFVTKHYTSGAAYMHNHNFLGTVWRYIISRRLVLTHRISFLNRRHHEDEFFTAVAYFYALRVIHVNLKVYAYCLRPGSLQTSITNRARMERLADFRYMLIGLKIVLRNSNLPHPIHAKALERRISFLTIDFLYLLFRNRARKHTILREVERLKLLEFLPLPTHAYTTKYIVAHQLINLVIR